MIEDPHMLRRCSLFVASSRWKWVVDPCLGRFWLTLASLATVINRRNQANSLKFPVSS